MRKRRRKGRTIMTLKKGRIVTMGEIMLRLKSPGNERLFQSPSLEATFGGGEANVAISLSNYGLDARFITALPQNVVGDSAIKFLNSMSVDTSCIIRQGERLGAYFLEAGSGPRPSNVIYDRAHSSISEAKTRDFNWNNTFSDADWFHITGITPALSPSASELSINALKKAKENGVTVSCDLNYRKKLWKYGKTAPEVMRQLMPYIDVVIANEEDIQKSLGMSLDQQIGGVKLDRDKYEQLAKKLSSEYPNVKFIAITLRESFSANHNDWSAMCYDVSKKKHHFSKKYSLKNIVDRVGGGDSFGGALIYALYTEIPPKDALEFAVAASALKHTIPGDVNRVSIEEVKRLAAGESSGRVQR